LIYQHFGFKLCDSGKLHVHLLILINAVKTNDKTVLTSHFFVYRTGKMI